MDSAKHACDQPEPRWVLSGHCVAHAGQAEVRHPAEQQAFAARCSESNVLGEGRAHRHAIATHELGCFVALTNAQVLDLNLAGVEHLRTAGKRPNHQVELLASIEWSSWPEQRIEATETREQRTTNTHVRSDAPSDAHSGEASVVRALVR